MPKLLLLLLPILTTLPVRAAAWKTIELYNSPISVMAGEMRSAYLNQILAQDDGQGTFGAYDQGFFQT